MSTIHLNHFIYALINVYEYLNTDQCSCLTLYIICQYADIFSGMQKYVFSIFTILFVSEQINCLFC